MTATIRSSAERALRRRDFVFGSRIDCHCRTQSARQAFEARLGNMMVIGAIKRLGVQCDAGVHGERLEPFLHQFGVERPDLVAYKLCLEHQERPPGNVDGDASSIGTCTSA